VDGGPCRNLYRPSSDAVACGRRIHDQRYQILGRSSLTIALSIIGEGQDSLEQFVRKPLILLEKWKMTRIVE